MGSVSVDVRRPARIGNSMGAVTDLAENMAVLARRPDIDFIVGDWMSEYNMASKGSSRAAALNAKDLSADGSPAFEEGFLESLQACVHDVKKNGIKLAVNAGCSDTERLYEQVCGLISREKLDLRIAWVEGDEVHDALAKCRAEGQKFRNITTGQLIDTWDYETVYAQCYLGSWGIVEAFRAGADIVVCGRVADAAPTIASAAYWHGWSRKSYRELAHALVAGHLIECSFYVTGGNFSGFKSMLRSTTPLMALPIASINSDGTFHILREDSPGRGGEVSVDTCISQLLYELQGKRYYNSDVVAIVDQIKMEQQGKNKVYVHNVGWELPPPTTKVGITAKGGFQAEVHYFMAGLDIEEKAAMLEEQIRYCLPKNAYTKLVFTTTGSCKPNPESQDAATVDFRIFAQSKTIEPVLPANFLKPCLNIVMSAYPGATFGMEQRHGFPKPYYEYFVTTIPQSVVKHVAHVPFADRRVEVAPPEDTVPYLPEQEIQETVDPLPLHAFGPTVNAPLGYVVHARSGDKGSDANVGFFVRHDDEFDWLRSLLSTSCLKQLVQNSYNGKRVERFELPHIRSVHFLLKDHLDRGVAATSNYDALGKNLAEYLRAKHVQVPIRFLGRGRI